MINKGVGLTLDCHLGVFLPRIDPEFLQSHSLERRDFKTVSEQHRELCDSPARRNQPISTSHSVLDFKMLDKVFFIFKKKKDHVQNKNLVKDGP